MTLADTVAYVLLQELADNDALNVTALVDKYNLTPQQYNLIKTLMIEGGL